MASSGPGEEDPLKEAKAYNDSILFMAAMPYTLFSLLGLMIYLSIRSARKKAEQEALAIPGSSPQLDAPLPAS